MAPTAGRLMKLVCHLAIHSHIGHIGSIGAGAWLA